MVIEFDRQKNDDFDKLQWTKEVGRLGRTDFYKNKRPA
jgi:hypothetical protein